MLLIKNIDGKIKYALTQDDTQQAYNLQPQAIENARKTTPLHFLRLHQYKSMKSWYDEYCDEIDEIIDLYTFNIEEFLMSNPSYMFTFNRDLFEHQMLNCLYKCSSSRQKSFV